jgi:hypothetical protein
MANRLQHLRYAAGALVLAAAGCAFPNGTTGGDPLLGNFNRPIIPTPPPERGGLGADTPAYDGGARIGVGAPDIAAPIENTSRFMSLPAPATPSPISGARLPSGGPDDVRLAHHRSTAGAQLPMPNDTADRAAAVQDPRELAAAPGGTPIGPSLPSLRPASQQAPHDPAHGRTIEEMQTLLQAAGAGGMRSEQVADGEWLFDCTIGTMAYQGRGGDPLEAMSVVLEQIQKGR